MLYFVNQWLVCLWFGFGSISRVNKIQNQTNGKSYPIHDIKTIQRFDKYPTTRANFNDRIDQQWKLIKYNLYLYYRYGKNCSGKKKVRNNLLFFVIRREIVNSRFFVFWIRWITSFDNKFELNIFLFSSKYQRRYQKYFLNNNRTRNETDQVICSKIWR